MRHKLLFLFITLLAAQVAHAQIVLKTKIWRSFSAADSTTTLIASPFIAIDDGVIIEEYQPERMSAEKIREGTRYVNIDPSMASYTPETLAKLFYGFENLQKISGLERLNTSKVQNMAYMFAGCKMLNNIDFGLNTEQVTDMSYMFADCHNAISIETSSFKTDKVTTMEGMFQNCYQLSGVWSDGFQGNAVKSIAKMFMNCKALGHIDLSQFNTPLLVNMDSAFFGCTLLRTLDINQLNIINVERLKDFVKKAPILGSVDMSDIKAPREIGRKLIQEELNEATLKYLSSLPPMFNKIPNIVYLSKGTWVCEEYRLNAHHSSYVILPFVAKKVTLEGQEFWSRKFNILHLPFSYTLPADAKAYVFKDVVDGVVHFTRYTGEALEANTPYLILSEHGVTSVPENVSVHQFGGYYINQKDWILSSQLSVESMRRTYVLKSNGLWERLMTYTFSPWSPCLVRKEATPYIATLNTARDGVVGIKHVALTDDATSGTTRIYDLNGHYLGTNREVLGKGIYIINGQKTQINATH